LNVKEYNEKIRKRFLFDIEMERFKIEKNRPYIGSRQIFFKTNTLSYESYCKLELLLKSLGYIEYMPLHKYLDRYVILINYSIKKFFYLTFVNMDIPYDIEELANKIPDYVNSYIEEKEIIERWNNN